MLTAFSSVEATKKLPYDITAFDAWSSKSADGRREEKFFIICWDKCHAGVYRLKEDEEPSGEAVDLVRSFKMVTPKPITQVAVFAELDFFLALSDGEVYQITLSAGQVVERLMKGTKALSFAVDWIRIRTRTDSRLRICVGSKKKLHFFHYDKRNRTMLPSPRGELLLPAAPKGLAWLGECIITCLKKDQCFFVSISTDSTTEELFPAGNMKQDAVMLQLPTRELAVMLDKDMIIFNIDLKQTGEIKWSEPPVDIVYSEPYFLAVLPSSVVEVRALGLSGLVQKVDMDKVKLIAGQGSHTFVTTSRDVVYLRPTSFSAQCDILVNRCQHELALSIAELIVEDHKVNNQRKTEIKEKYAFHLFVQQNFIAALKMFRSVETDPQHVIALYPSLLPSETRKRVLDYFPSSPPTLTGKQLEDAMVVLVEYLNETCRMLELSRVERDENETVPLPSSWEIQDEGKMMTLLVTTILKCYLATNWYMVAPFVRRKGKYLDLLESEKCLKKFQRYEELVELYNTNGKHVDALNVLFDCHRNSPTPSLEGISPTIKYLEMLGNANIDIVLHYSKWVLEENPEGGLKIFTNDLEEVRELNRVRVVRHLEDTCQGKTEIVQQYLEHVTSEWKDTNPSLHNKLVELYLDKFLSLAKSGQDARVARKKLLLFLRSSQSYTAEYVISSFPQDDLFEEHAILMGRLGRHEAALAIYAHILKNHNLALEHCRTYSDQETSAEVYHTLVGVYISPPNLLDLGLTLPKGCQVKPDIPSAIRVLNDHYEQIDTAKVLDLLPDGTEMSEVVTFLRLVFQNCSHKRRQLQVLRGLTYSQRLQVNRESIRTFDKAFVITDDTTCAICGKKLGGAFAREPDGRLRHMYCEL